MKDKLFYSLRRVVESERGRDTLLDSLAALRTSPPAELGLALSDLPYAELPPATRSPASERDDVIFITARFRSGSTFLWNLFRNVQGTTAYYEPFNERRWFDKSARGDRVDTTHRQVNDYWREYEGLEELGQYYEEAWTRRNLYMDETAWEPQMKRYVETLIDKAAGRPVLQFNRIDFRLPWFRKHFPRAKIVHLFRHPRDQWLSTLLDSGCGLKAGFEQFQDRFYLRSWGHDLQLHFPFFREAGLRHPYELFYLVWRLSYLFGRRFAHLSLGYETLLADPNTLPTLFRELAIEADLAKLQTLFAPPEMGKWRNYADDTWFRSHESYCENQLHEFFGETTAITQSTLIKPLENQHATVVGE